MASRAFMLAALVWLTAAAATPSLRAQTEQAPACPATVDALMTQLRGIKGLRASFVEEKHMALLAAPLVNRGTIVFSREGSLLRTVEQPQRSAMWLSGGILRLRDENGERQMAASRWQAVDALVNSYLHLMGGDKAALMRQYELALGCEGPRWQLRLTPRSGALRGVIRQLEMGGLGASVQSMVLLDGNGDRSVTKFHEVRTDVAYSAAQLQQMYSSAAP